MTTNFKLPCSSTHPAAIKAAERFPKRLEEVHEGRIVLRDDAVYKSNKKPIEVKCSVCGHEWNPRPHDLTSHSAGCPECHRLRCVESAGTLRTPHASKAEKELARCMRRAGMTYRAIAGMLGRSKVAITNWCDPVALEKDREKSRKKNARYRASGQRTMLGRNYRQTAHGKANRTAYNHQRRALEYHALDTILVDGCWYQVDMYPYITTAEDRDFWSFTGADEDVRKRKGQQEKLAEISGEPYSLEHLIPLSKGGIHAPCNFANRALALNTQKNDSFLDSDTRLFCSRLFCDTQ
jgi:transposase-like protein